MKLKLRAAGLLAIFSGLVVMGLISEPGSEPLPNSFWLSSADYEKEQRIGNFSGFRADGGHPEGWEELRFRGINETNYQLVHCEELGKTVVRAESSNSGSGLINRTQIDLREYPLLSWSWKTDSVLEEGDVTKKSGDDYAVRIYVIFDYSARNLSWLQRQQVRLARLVYGEVPTRAMSYIWDYKSEAGTVVPNPYTNLVKMIVKESGREHEGSWRSYTTDVYQDYIDIYGEEPPRIAAVAIMTDTDDTGSETTSFFGDIVFHTR
ncbi:MAG: DUF3047 domain-containing protein [Balneolales bacterium]|nr:DUF3047 domain-containing protein [Balneolales bacterium]